MRIFAFSLVLFLVLPGCDAVSDVLDSFDQPSAEQLAQLTDTFGCEVRAVTNSGSRDGSLAGGDCELNDGSLVDLYAFQISSETNLRATMTASSFDPYLLLFTSSGAVLDEGGASGDDSVILDTRVNDGLFVLAANSVDRNETGTYTITVERR